MISFGDSPASRSRSNCLPLLRERRLSSDYDVARSLGGASDLEVNMESEADVQALNASEEDVVCTAERTPGGSLFTRRCHDDRRRRRRRRSRDDSSLYDSSESESDSSDASSTDQQHQSLFDRLRHCKPRSNLRIGTGTTSTDTTTTNVTLSCPCTSSGRIFYVGGQSGGKAEGLGAKKNR